jgi:hypothetical protein
MAISTLRPLRRCYTVTDTWCLGLGVWGLEGEEGFRPYRCLEKSVRDCHPRLLPAYAGMTGGRLVVDLIRVDLMRWTLIDHAPRKDMIRTPKVPS